MQRWPLLIALVSLGACGGGEVADDVVPPSTVDHAAVLADHETAELAARLTAVPGYSFVDPPAEEVAAFVDQLHETEARNDREQFFAAVSYHGVVAADTSQNKAHTAEGGAEVGFLVLMSFTVEPPVVAEENPLLLVGLFEGSDTEFSTHTIGGVPMLLADKPESDDSRFTYAWLGDGVLHLFDGATRSTMERWLEQYVVE